MITPRFTAVKFKTYRLLHSKAIAPWLQFENRLAKATGNRILGSGFSIVYKLSYLQDDVKDVVFFSQELYNEMKTL